LGRFGFRIWLETAQAAEVKAGLISDGVAPAPVNFENPDRAAEWLKPGASREALIRTGGGRREMGFAR
jgi:hypothetical protein